MFKTSYFPLKKAVHILPSKTVLKNHKPLSMNFFEEHLLETNEEFAFSHSNVNMDGEKDHFD